MQKSPPAPERSKSGPLDGAPLQDLALRITRVELFGAASTPRALRIAAGEAARKAIRQAGAVLLHPIMATEIVVPAQDVGVVIGDLQARRALIQATQTLGEVAVITCGCPLDKLLGYITDLRGMTHGRGQFTMTFDRFDVV